MIEGQRIAVVMPAYNAQATLQKTYGEISREIVDDIILVDDQSKDETVRVAEDLDLLLHVHLQNLGYGGNQKSCYRLALQREADIVVMLHPDYQYTPRLIPAMASMIASGHYDVVLGSRILGGGALPGGMPRYKYIANRFLTLVENMLLGTKLSEFHTGYRAFSREVLLTLPLEENSDDFVFDNQMLVQTVQMGFSIGEISCPTRYFSEASSINFARSCKYGIGVIATAIRYRLAQHGLIGLGILNPEGRRLQIDQYSSESEQ